MAFLCPLFKGVQGNWFQEGMGKMDFDPAFILQGPSLLQAALSTSGIVFGSVGLAAVAWKPAGKIVLPDLAETYLRDFLPFDRMLADDQTIRCKDGRLVQVIALGGHDSGGLSGRDRDDLYRKRKAFFEAFEEKTWIELTVVSLRRRTAASGDSDARWDVPAFQEMFDLYDSGFSESYVNRHFLILSVAGRTAVGRGKLDEAVSHALAALDDFGPTVLTNGRKGFSPLLSFWAELVNAGNPGPIGRMKEGLASGVCATTVNFLDEGGILEFRDGPHVTYGAALGIPRWGDNTAEATVARILSLPCEMTILHLMKSRSLIEAQAIQERRKRWMLASRFNEQIAEQLKAADAFLIPNSSVRQTEIRYQMTIFLYSADRAELDGLVQRARIALQDYGIRLVREGSGSAERLWFSQFPGTRQFVHSQDFYSSNVADLVSLEAPAIGLDRSDWCSEPILLLRQINGAPYKFQFHISDEQEAVGHMAMFGPTGSGKTLMMNFLMAASLKVPNLRWFRFDRDQGAFPFTRCLGRHGQYLALQSDMETDDSCSLNPFQMTMNGANEGFLVRWLRERARIGDDPAAMEEIGRFLKALKEPGLPQGSKSLSALINTTFRREGAAFKGLRQWADPNLYGRYFNAARDTFDPSRGGRVVSVDVTQVFADDVLAPAVSDYLLHRILNSTKEAKIPFGIFVDETEPMVRASVEFKNDLRRILQEVRRARGVAVLAFQRPKAIAELGMQELILGQCPTLVFFRNPRATNDEYGVFDLTPNQMAIIQGKAPAVRGKRRYVLLVRNTPSRRESVVVDFDLAALGDYVRMLRGGRDAIDAVVASQQMWNEDWLEHYLHGFDSTVDEDDTDE